MASKIDYRAKNIVLSILMVRLTRDLILIRSETFEMNKKIKKSSLDIGKVEFFLSTKILCVYYYV